MDKKLASRREILNRWRGIEEEEEEEEYQDDDRINDPSKHRRIHQQKEQWFADAYNFLISLPKENHIWCSSWDLMGPLLETFYNYLKDERPSSPLRRLWRRISEEMQCCIQCISQHHQAQELYSMEYELSSIGPLLNVLRSLDEERVTHILRERNFKLAEDKCDPTTDNAGVVCLMYEVLMYPVLLDDQSLFTEFEKFIEAVDNMHELTLAGEQQFPGVYALFFFKRRVRSVGHRLAGFMGRLRKAADLEPLQPLLKKFIGFLEMEVLPSTLKTSRPRAELDRTSIWLGIKSLLGFLEPPAFEEGILERYPIFLDIVLNHISGDTVDFSHAITCLRLIFEMLGCKVWLRSTLSPSVMRNTLLGQCFHTRNEKTHKDIFDLFQPFLQSLEALQDGELEKQRRNFLYFLLYQVPVSSNFSVMIRQKACQIALLIVHRGYTMDPPCPPFECAHMWGPALVLSLKDSSLHNSLRQPAFDLIQAIMVSDAAALIGSILSCSPQLSRRKLHEFDDENIGELLFTIDAEEKDDSCWRCFCIQSKIASLEFREWKCIPMLWIDVLVDINPSVLPLSVSKAVFWARSRFSLVEHGNSSKMPLPVRTWLLSSATDISACFGWKVPTGSDDGGDKESKNSMEVSTMSLPLMQTFKRLTTHFIAEVVQSELRKQWTWEPRMGESLILSLLDPDDTIRQFGKCILEQVSTTRGLACGLKFLCSSTDSLAAIFFGLRHAVKLVQLDTVVFQTLHHFFFVIYKLLKEGDLSTIDELGKSSDSLNLMKFSIQGGFLRQPVFDCLPVNINDHSTDYSKLLEKFYYLLSKIIWPSVRRCLMEGKEFTDYSNCQMTCVRLLEVVPVVFERLYPLNCDQTGSSSPILKSTFDFSWLHDLVDWGKSSLKVVFVYWKRTVSSLLKLLRSSCNDTDLLTVSNIENLISCDTVSVDELMEQVSHLSVSLCKKSSCDIGKNSFISKAPYSESLLLEMKDQPPEVHLLDVDDTDIQILDSPRLAKTKAQEDLIILSDDEKVVSPCDVDSVSKTGQCMLGRSTIMLSPRVDESTLSIDPSPKNVCGINPSKALLKPFPQRDDSDVLPFLSQKELNKLREKPHTSVSRSEALDGNWKEIIEECTVVDSFNSKSKVHLKELSDEAINSIRLDDNCDKVVSKAQTLLKERVCETEDDTLESALDSTRQQFSHVEKSSMLIPKVPKRQLIQLETPVDRSDHFQRLHAQAKRFKPPRLDEWYKPILETDYFVTVGLASASEDGKCKGSKLKEVPISFQSPEQYVQIFQPLVLEEFKAQLQSSFLEMSSWEEIYFGRLSVLSIERVDDFHIVRCSHDDDDPTACRSFLENDLILFTKEPPQNTSHDVHMVGKVERRERDNKRRISILLIRLYLQNGTARLHQARRKLLERSKWHASRIMTMSPQLREFQALSSIKEIPLLPVILNPSYGSCDSNESKEVNLSKLSQPLQRILKSSFNDSQLQAISVATGLHNARKSIELSLIQGPPGSGKTRTILAIASALLASPLWRTDNVNFPVHRSLKQNNTSLPKICQTAAIARAWQDAALAKQLNEDIQNSSKSTESSARRRVLICAQSNAAVDELVSRVSSHGLHGSDGRMYKPYLVRVGNAKTVHPNSLPFFIDTLVDQRLTSERMQLSHGSSGLSVKASVSLRSNLETLMDRIRFYEAKRASLSDENSDFGNSLEDGNCQEGDKKMSDVEIGLKLRKLYEQKRQIYKDLSTVHAQEKKASDEIKGLKYKLRRSILKEAEIVVTTLSGCGGDLYRVCSESMSNHKFGSPSEHTLFDAVVIDEAAQALEPATLIPLQLLKSSGTKCIMVGDPKQLPATVLSNTASKFLYECSMFERLQKAGHPVVMLTEQYRMHPEICQFPSLHFYDSKLLNGCDILSKTAPFHETEGLGPYIFYNVIDGREHRGENSGALSLYNEQEANAAVELLKFFKKRHPSEFVAGRIGILTPYKCQLSLLRSRFSSAFGSSVACEMEFNTVDGFQGREVDILILSTVRASELFSVPPVIKSSNIGFVADVRRMNVALTRARLSLWIMGNAETLQTNENWAALVKNAKDRNLVKTVNMPYKSMYKTAPQRIPGVENSDVHLVKSKCYETVENATRNGKQYKSANKSFETKTNFKHRAVRRGFVDEKDTPAIKEGSLIIKENATDDLQANVRLSSVAASVDCKLSESGKSVISEKHVADVKSKVKESCRSLENSHLGKFKDSRKNLDHLKSQISGKPETSTRSNGRSRNNEVSTSIGCHIERGYDRGRNPHQVDTSEDLIAKRKQQRDEVDAILYSALISSKKSDKLVKPVPAKRPSSSAASGSMRSSKKRKD